MYALLILLTLISFSENLTNVKNFINNLTISENINFVIFVSFSDVNFSQEIINDVNFPKIIIDLNEKFNYLNLPFEDEYNEILNLPQIINNNLLIILFAENFVNILNSIENVRNNLIVWISFENILTANETLLKFHNENYLNVIYLSIQDFEIDRQFLTFERFPKFEIVSKQSFSREDVSNVKGANLKMLISDNYPFIVCINETIEAICFGHYFNIVYNFGYFIGSIIEIVYNSSIRDLYQFDIRIITIKHNLLLLKKHQFSYPIEKALFQIAIPKPNPIDSNLYILKPFSLKLWMFLIGILTLISFIISSSLYITQKSFKFGIIFNQILRSFLAQPFGNRLSGSKMSIIYILSIIFGFIITNLYYALIGSFLTKRLHEPQIKTIDELKKSNIVLKSFLELLVVVDLDTFSEFAELMDFEDGNKVGLILNNFWFQYLNINEYFEAMTYSIGTGFLRVWFDMYSIYKDRFDRYINIILDTGLYIYWKRSYDLKKTGLLGIHKPKVSSKKILRVLDLSYYFYPFIGLTIGYLVGSFIFIIENLKFYKFKGIINI